MVFTFTQTMVGNFREEQAFDLVWGVCFFLWIFNSRKQFTRLIWEVVLVFFEIEIKINPTTLPPTLEFCLNMKRCEHQ